MSLILKQETSGNVPTPAAGKGTLFLTANNQVAVKDAAGTTASFVTIDSAGNTQILYNDAGSLGGDSSLTFNKTTDLLSVANLTVTGTLIAGDIAVSSIANGTSNVDIVGVSGNVTTSVAGVANVLVVTSTGANITGTLNTTGNANVGNLGALGIVATTLDGSLITNAQPNITSVGTLSSLAITGNASAGNFDTVGKVIASTFESNVADGTAPIVVISTTKVANLNADLLDGYSTATTATANTVVIRDNNGSFSANIITAALSGAATVAGTVTTAAQPNITSVGTLSSLSVTGNISAGNISTGGILSVTGNANVGNLETTQILATANITAPQIISNIATGTAPFIVTSTTKVANLNAETVDGYDTDTTATANTIVVRNTDGNISGNYFIGNGSQLTGIDDTSIQNGNSNVKIYANANVEISVSGNANIVSITGTGVNVSGTFNSTGNSNVGNLGTGGLIVATGNIDGGNLTTSGVVSATGNVTGGNLTTAGALSVTGNANVGNIGAAAGVFTTVDGTLTTAAQPNITSVGTLSSLSVTGNVSGGNITTGGVVSATGNVSGGNITTGGVVSATGNVSGGNITTGGVVSATGNITGSNLNTSGNVNSSIVVNGGTGIYLSPGPSGYINLFTSTGDKASISDTGNIIASNLIANSTVFAVTANISGNVTGGNLTTAGALSVTGNANIGNIGATSGIFTNVQGTLTTSAQPNITSVGTLSSIAVTGNGTFGNVYANSGTIGATNLTGTLTTNAQPNVTSVGTLTSLGVNGNFTAANITANTGVFTGNGSGLSAIAGANVTGQVANAIVAGTVYTAAQPNITSVGTLTSVSVTGNVAAGNLTTTGILSVTGPGPSSIAGNLDMTGNTITNLATPTNSSDAATKQYVDDVAQGLHTHDSCNAATQTTLATISGGTVTYDNGTSGVGATLTTTGSYTTIDGVTLSNGMRILVKDEANTAHNGIYDRTSSTVLTRSDDFNTPTEMAGGDFTFVTSGTLYDNTGWVMPDPVTTVGTSAVVWVQFSGAGTYTAGTGLTLTGSQFSVNVAQPQITSVGTLTGLGVNGTITGVNITANTGIFTGNGSGLSAIAGANVTGQVANALVAGTVYTAAQSNITSVGTLTGLGVNGNITAANITANTGVFTGNGSGLSSIAGGNVTGQVANALVAGTVYTAAQPNITSVGTLSSLSVTGNASAGNISTGGTLNVTGNANVGNIGGTNGVFTSVSGNGSALTALNASNISTGTLAQARLANSTLTLGDTILTLGGTTTTVTGLSGVTATTFTGSLSGAATTAGTVTTAAQPNITSVGTLSSLSVTGNGSFGNVSATTFTGALSGAATTAGTVTTAAQPNITSVGTLTGLGVNGTITGVNITANTGVFTGNGSALTALNASNISTGTLEQARLANASVTLGSTALTLGSTVTTVAGLSSVTSTTFVGALTGAATTAGTVTTNAQPNITSVGTLTSVAVTGNVTAGNIIAGGGSGGNITGANLVSANFFTGTLTTAAQPNITSVGTLTSLTTTTITTGANTTAGSMTGNWTLTAGSRFNATYADLAERYVADMPYEPGTVVVFAGEYEVSITGEADSTRVAGVVSTNPAYLMNSECEGEHVVDLALIGRVPVRVQGPVNKGDLLVTSEISGFAKANNEARAGTIIGKALENFNGPTPDGLIEVLVGRS